MTTRVFHSVTCIWFWSEADDSSAALPSTSYNSSSTYSHMPWSATPILTSAPHSIETSHLDTSHSTHWPQTAQPGSQGFGIPQYPPNAISAPVRSLTQEQFPHYSNSPVGESHGWSQLPHYPVRSMSLASPLDLQHYHSQYHNDPHAFSHRHPTNAPDLHPPSLSSNTNSTPPGSSTYSTPTGYTYSDHAQMRSAYHPMAPMQSPSMAVSSSDAFGSAWYSAPQGLAEVKEEEEHLATMHHHFTAGQSGRRPV